MNADVERLLQISGDSLLPKPTAEQAGSLAGIYGSIGELVQLLELKNGFYAFESALHLFPMGTSSEVMTLERWNSSETWRASYGDLIPESMLFFAQDVFGDQFALDGGKVYHFQSECGKTQKIASSLAEWVSILVTDWRNVTGHQLGHDWQIANRSLLPDERLVAKIPFVMGGEYSIDNLYAGNMIEAMRFRGYFAQQIKELPDGARVVLHPINVPLRKRDDSPASNETSGDHQL